MEQLTNASILEGAGEEFWSFIFETPAMDEIVVLKEDIYEERAVLVLQNESSGVEGVVHFKKEDGFLKIDQELWNNTPKW